MLIKKTLYDKLVAKKDNIDTSDFKCSTDKTVVLVIQQQKLH